MSKKTTGGYRKGKDQLSMWLSLFQRLSAEMVERMAAERPAERIESDEQAVPDVTAKYFALDGEEEVPRLLCRDAADAIRLMEEGELPVPVDIWIKRKA